MAKDTLDYTKLEASIKLLSGSSPATATGGSYLGEVVSIQGVWSLNSIPSMQVIIPMGSHMQSQSASYAYQSGIKDAFAKRQPVGIYLNSSNSLPGLFQGEKCLFKGYIDSESTVYSYNNGALSLTLCHWLSDLNIFSILARLSAPDNPIDISQDPILSLDVYKDETVSDGTLVGKAWTVGDTYKNAINKGIFEAIKAGLSEAFGETKNLKPQDPGYLNKALYNKARTALKCMKSKYLSFRGKDFGKDTLQKNIGDFLHNEISSNYYSVTLWQKLIQTLLPSFLLGVIPLVDKAYVVPSPGLCMTPKMGRNITENDIVSLQIHKKGPSLLGGVFITADCQEAGETTYSVKKGCISSYMYPNPPDVGVLKACTIPGWLAASTRAAGCMTQMPRIYSTSRKAPNYATRAAKKYAAEADLFKDICKSMAQAIYVSEITSSHTATVNTTLRFDIVPGDVVCIQVPRDKILELDAEKFYGIVQTVSYTISSTQVGTTYMVTHLRSEELMKKIKQNTAIIYQQGWRPSGDNSAHLYE